MNVHTFPFRKPASLTRRLPLLAAFLACVPASARAQQPDPSHAFPTSDRCVICHNGIKTAAGQDVSMGAAWRATMMANSSRDPYWQASVRRETLDHADAAPAIENTCAHCHMPLQRLIDKTANQPTSVFTHLPFPAGAKPTVAADGVSCAVCHQVQPVGLGTPATYNGEFTVAPLTDASRPAFGPYDPSSDQAIRAHVAITGLAPVHSDHMRQAALCGSCHTLYTTSIDAAGKSGPKLPEQMTFLEWEHSDYRDKQTCQQCHMPAVNEPVKIAMAMSQPRDGVRVHSFVGSNFEVPGMLKAHRDELGVAASADDLDAAIAATTAYLKAHAAKVSLDTPKLVNGELQFAVKVENLSGHKLPTSFPSRRAWLHVVVATDDGKVVFESGKLNPDGSIAGNANDLDPTRYEPHFSLIRSSDQVQIFEPILGDAAGHVTTGLLSATRYLKDNRILPAGFDKASATADIAVYGDAAKDSEFTAGSATTHYAVNTGKAASPLHITAELLYQPIGYRWAQNLAPYKAAEPAQFSKYFSESAAKSAVSLAHADATVGAH